MTPPSVDDPLLLAVAAYGLPGAGRTFPGGPLDDITWESLLGGVGAHRMTGLMAAAVREEELPTTPAQRAQIDHLHGEAMALAVVLDRLLLRVAGVLDDAGIPFRALKGSSLAHGVYPDPSWRQFGDIDVLIPSAPYDDALAALAAAGYRRSRPQLRPGFDRRFGKGTTLRSDEGHWIDLHRTFVVGPLGLRVRTQDLFDETTLVRIGGRDIPSLGPTLRLLHACYAAALGDLPPRLVSLRDLAQMALAEPVDLPAMLEVANRWGGRAVIARAVRLTWDTLGIADRVQLSEWSARYVPTRADQRALATYLAADSRYGTKALASLTAIHGLRAKTAFVAALALPSREFLQRVGAGPLGWLRRGSRSLIRRGGRQT